MEPVQDLAEVHDRLKGGLVQSGQRIAFLSDRPLLPFPPEGDFSSR